jgi:hypothetical protein
MMMTKKNWLIGAIIIVSGCHTIWPVPPHDTEKAQTLVLFDFGKDFDVGKAEMKGGKAVVSKDGALRIKASGRQRATITLKAPAGHWDLSRFLYVAMDVHNTGRDAALVRCLVDNNGWVDGAVTVEAGEKSRLKVLLMRNSPPASVKEKLFGMNGLPGGYVWIWEPIDLRKVSGLFIRIPEAKAGQIVEIDNIRATGSYNPPSEKELSIRLGSTFTRTGLERRIRSRRWPITVRKRRLTWPGIRARQSGTNTEDGRQGRS